MASAAESNKGGDSLLQTRVDQLVSLIKSTKKISVSDAAKSIGVPSDIVLEWAEFLEKEGVIEIQYKMTTPYLVDKIMSNEELEVKAKEFHTKKDTILRRAEASLFNIEKQSKAFEGIKKEFEKLKEEIGEDMKGVRSELDEFQKYDQFKRDIDNEMMKHQNEFKSQLDQINKEIGDEQKKYKEILEGIDAEERILEAEEGRVKDIKESEAELKSKLDELKSIISKYENVVGTKDETIQKSKVRIEKLKKYAEDVKAEINKKKSKILKPLEDKSKEYEERISDLQQRVLKKVLERRKEIDSNIKEAEDAASKFEKFFDKNDEVSQLLDKLEKDKVMLKKDLQELVQKARVFNIASKGKKFRVSAEQLESKMQEVEERKSTFERQLRRLQNLILGGR
ncbi:hypothetical protein DRJ25_04030 [Candidatus Woesearchaeota archaeon]|nr:MAG: hypothetical protein DRJ25_04030 [Candidatus Woesearchaeota archaeon]